MWHQAILSSFSLTNALERQLPWGDDQKYVDLQKKLLKDNYLCVMDRGELWQRLSWSRLNKILKTSSVCYGEKVQSTVDLQGRRRKSCMRSRLKYYNIVSPSDILWGLLVCCRWHKKLSLRHKKVSVAISGTPKAIMTGLVVEMFLLMSGTNNFAKKYFLTPFWDSTKFSLFCKVRACRFSVKNSIFQKLPQML